jgi:hypothetical protein
MLWVPYIPPSNEHFEIFLGRNPLQSTYWIVQNTLKQLDFLDLFFLMWTPMTLILVSLRSNASNAPLRTPYARPQYELAVLFAAAASLSEFYIQVRNLCFFSPLGCSFQCLNQSKTEAKSLNIKYGEFSSPDFFFLSHQVGCGSDL